MNTEKSILIFILAAALLSSCIMQTPTPAQAPASTPIPVQTPRPGADLTPPSAIAPTPAYSPLRIRAEPVKPFYLPGEEVEIKFIFENTDSKPFTLSPYPPEIMLIKRSSIEMVRLFSHGSEKLEIDPGKEAIHILKWDQRDSRGHQVSPGYYDARDGVSGMHEEFEMVLIQFPQGATEKTIKVNQSQTVKNITVTLERVELSATGARVYALAKLPALIAPQTPASGIPTPTPTPFDLYCRAWYRVDNATEQTTFDTVSEQTNDGIRVTWNLIDPIPSDAREMTFAITWLGISEGPWEFRVSLG